MTVFDAFPLAYGPEVLDIRLHELADVVDKFVIVEADRTFPGAAREPLWPALASTPRFRDVADRVDWTWVTMPERMIGYPWAADGWLRDVLLDIVLELADGQDYVLFGDHDEIPHPDAVRHVADRGIERARLWGRYHEWFLNLGAVGGPFLWEFRQPLLFRASEVERRPIDGSTLRAGQFSPGTGRALEYGRDFGPWPSGWHFTLQGSLDAITEKLYATAHTELRKVLPRVGEIRERREDIISRCALERVPDRSLPRYVQDNWEYFAGLGMLLP